MISALGFRVSGLAIRVWGLGLASCRLQAAGV